MPFISTKTNVKVTKEKETQLKERLGQAISIIPGKSESWLMLAIEGDIPMYFRGDDSQPTAFIEVKIYGGASSDIYGRMTKELTGIYNKLRPYGITDRALQSIEDVTNPLLNSINEKCARIRGAFVGQFDNYMAKNYYVDGVRGEVKKIALPRNLVVWE